MTDPIPRLNAALEGRYRIESELGEGGMATVYLADDLKHDRKVALKVLKPELAAALGAERFLAEIRTTANLQHPHILPLFDSGEADSFLFYVMPYVEGESLRERLDRETQLPVDEAIQIAADVAEALDHAHRQGIVHRDIKPANILMRDGRPLVADFGISLAIGRVEGTRLTDTGLSIGTPTYMSPEQGLGDHEVGARSDIYSLGCVLYEMLVGDPPFSGSNTMAVLVRKSTEAPPGVRVVRDTVSEATEKVVLRALARTPADRQTSARTFAEELRSAPRAVAASSPSARKLTRSGGFAVVAAVALLVLAGQYAWTRGDTTLGVIERIAVLPLANSSGDPAFDFWGVGLQDALWSELATLAALTMTPPQATMAYVGTTKRPSAIAEELRADALLGGSVLASGGRVRLTLYLTRGDPEDVVWSDVYEGDVSDVHLLTAQVARDVAAAILLVVTDDEQRRLSNARREVPAAVVATMKGREVAGGSETQVRRAIGFYDDAIAIDSSYVPAWVGLAQMYNQLAYVGTLPPDSTVGRAQLSALRAIDIDPDSGPAYAALGWTLAVKDWDWDGAIAAYRRGLDLTPSQARGRLLYSFVLAWLGRFDEAKTEARRAEQDFPGRIGPITNTSVVLSLAREYDAAIEKAEEAAEMGATMFALARLTLAYSGKGDYEQALVYAEEAVMRGADASRRSNVAYLYALDSREAEARSILDDLLLERSNGAFVSPLNIAQIYLALGDVSTALDWIESGFEERDPDMGLLGVWPWWDPLRREPRFQSVLERMGLPDELIRGG
jgi:eukaryotic-like serine/threonine-protein kinase